MIKTNNEKGRALVVLVGIYLIAKPFLNLIIAHGKFGDILFGAIVAVGLYSGMQYMNYIIAAVLAWGFVKGTVHNISNIGNDWRCVLWLLEGVIDAGAAALLCLQKDVKEHFTNRWDELNDLIEK